MKKILLGLLSLFVIFSTQTAALSANESEYPLDTSHLPMVSENYILMERETGAIVAGRNISKKIHPASITKSLTIIAGLEKLEKDQIDLNTMMRVSPTIFPIDREASIAMFNPDDKFSYDDVFYGLALPSGADAANALSYDLTGSAEGLTEDMNALAKRIGMKDTYFVNTTGLDDDNHLTTVYDLALGIDYSLNSEDFRRYYTTSEHLSGRSRMHPKGIKWVDGTLKRAEELEYTQIIGAKSGYTPKAQRSVSLLIESQGREYVYISTNASNKQSPSITVIDAMKVVNEMENNFTRMELYLKDVPMKSKNVFGLSKSLDVQFDHSQLLFLNANQSQDKVKIKYDHMPFVAFKKIKAGQEIGTLNVMHEEELLYTTPIIAQSDVSLSILMIILMIILGLVVVAFVLTLLSMAYFALIRRRNRRNRRRTLRR